MRILVIENDILVAEVLERRLTQNGLNVQHTDMGEDGLDLARHYPFDLVLLDLDLPDITGDKMVRRLKLINSRLPIMVLSGDDSVETRLRCFRFGVDDFQVKPWHDEELVARVRAITRRFNGHVIPTLEIGDLRVNTQTRQVSAADIPVTLTRREYQVIELLAIRHGSTVTKEAMLNHIYGGINDPGAKIIDVYVHKIRRKLVAVAPHLGARIETVWGRGYALKLGEPFLARSAALPATAACVG